jgi:hypothetical protein
VSISALPPPPQLAGHIDSDLGEPWVTTAADLIADLLTDPARGETLVATGNAALDAGGGLAPGTLTALLAGPGPGATAAMAAVAHHAAYHLDLATLLYPLRCTAAAIATHLAHSHRHDPHRSGDGGGEVVAQLRTCPLYVSVGSPITVSRIFADALDADMDPPKLIVVDAVGLLHPAGAGRDLKHLALELNIAVLCSATVRTATNRAITGADAPADIAASADTIVTLPTGRTAPTRPRPKRATPLVSNTPPPPSPGPDTATSGPPASTGTDTRKEGPLHTSTRPT